MKKPAPVDEFVASGAPRPTPAEIISVLALHFHVSAGTVARWLRELKPDDFKGWL